MSLWSAWSSSYISPNNAVAKMQDTNVKKREFQSSSAKAATDSVSPVMKVVLSAAQKGRFTSLIVYRQFGNFGSS